MEMFNPFVPSIKNHSEKCQLACRLELQKWLECLISISLHNEKSNQQLNSRQKSGLSYQERLENWFKNALWGQVWLCSRELHFHGSNTLLNYPDSWFQLVNLRKCLLHLIKSSNYLRKQVVNTETSIQIDLSPIQHLDYTSCKYLSWVVTYTLQQWWEFFNICWQTFDECVKLHPLPRKHMGE